MSDEEPECRSDEMSSRCVDRSCKDHAHQQPLEHERHRQTPKTKTHPHTFIQLPDHGRRVVTTISSRIDDMSDDILAQVVADLISSPAKFQLDESTDVSNLSQLVVFVRYVKDDVIKEDFLFSKPLTTTTKAVDVKKLVYDNDLSWNMVSAVCSDRAPAMLGRQGFGALVKSDAPHIIVTHCVLHRHALATETLPPKLAEVLKIVVECVNYMRNSAMKHCIFKELLKEMGSEFEVLLYHSNVLMLSRGKVLNRVFAMRVELALFLREYQHCHADHRKFILILVYMADIFDALNHLNRQMQGGRVNIIEAEENLTPFKKKLPLWKRRTEIMITSQTFPCWTTV